METSLEMLKELTEASGVSGYEGEIRSVLTKYLSPYAAVEQDGLGCIIARQEGKSVSPTVMLAAHMDEIGFMVKTITKEGFIKFLTLGGWWDQVLLGQRVVVKTRKGDVHGIIGSKPPHILSGDDRNKVVNVSNMFIDVGAADKEDAESKLNIRPGDPIIPVSPFTVLGDGKRYLAKAWDDRVGCALLCDIARKFARAKHSSTLAAVATVQEEVGTQGAETSVCAVKPDIAIVLEASIASDVPGGAGDSGGVKLDEGATIFFYDRSMIPNLKLRDFVVDIAEKHNIPYQLDFMEGGATDGGKIHLYSTGVPTIVLAVPTRYIHSHAGVISSKDYDDTFRLLSELVGRLDEKTVAEFVK